MLIVELSGRRSRTTPPTHPSPRTTTCVCTCTRAPVAQMELQWEHIGYELEPDGTMSSARPLFRCPLCRVCKSIARPNQEHAPDCKLRGLLDEFSGQRFSDSVAVIHDQRLQRREGRERSSSPPPVIAASVGGGGARGGAGAGGGGRGGWGGDPTTGKTSR